MGVGAEGADHQAGPVVTTNIGGVNFDRNYMAFTLAFVPKGGDILAPSTSSAS